MTRYNARVVEPKWQAEWEKAGVFVSAPDSERQKYYVLELFPYPSGRIHMGHVRNYAMGDVIARYKRARLQCPASDGMGCLWSGGRKRRHGTRRASQGLDLFEHRRDARSAEIDGPEPGLVPRAGDL